MLRLGSGNRRKTDTEEPNSVERGAHRRKASVPVRVCFAGAGEREKSVPPASLRSTEDRVRIRAKLRLTFACRRKTDTEEPNSVEKGAHRRKAPASVRVCFAGAGTSVNFLPPGSLRCPEDSIRIRIQLRLGSGNRRKMNTEEPNSVERGAHRRKAVAPVRVCFAGAGASVNFVPPTSRRSSEDSIRSRAQLQLEPGNGRRAGQRHRTSDEGAFVGGGRHPRAVVEFVQNFFNILDTFPFTNYTYRGIIISR